MHQLQYIIDEFDKIIKILLNIENKLEDKINLVLFYKQIREVKNKLYEENIKKLSEEIDQLRIKIRKFK